MNGHHDDRRPDERVVEYLYGELSPKEAAAFEEELKQNAALAAEVRGLQSVVRLAAEGDASIPEPPEGAIAEVLAEARARCDRINQPDVGFWERAAAWLLTPQLAGALTLVLVVSVGVYTIQTGVFDREAADEPSLKHEMAPVGPTTETFEISKKEKAKEGKDAAPAKTVAQEPPMEATAEPEPTQEAEPEESGDAALEWTEPAPEQLQEAAREAPAEASDQTIVDAPIEAPGRGEAAADLRKEIATGTTLNAAASLSVDMNTIMAGQEQGDEGEALDAVKGVIRGGNNFVTKSVKKPEAPKTKKATAAKHEKKLNKRRESKVLKEQASREEGRREDTWRKKKDQAAAIKTPATLDLAADSGGQHRDLATQVKTGEAETTKERTTKEKATGTAGGAPVKAKDDKQREVGPTRPKLSRSVLDGVVVPPSASPAPEKRKAEAQAPQRVSKKSISLTSTGMERDDDGFLGVDVANSEAGVPVSATAQLATGYKEELEDEEVNEAPAAPPMDRATLCAALAQALEEAKKAGDEALIKELTRQLETQGCLSGPAMEFDAAEKVQMGSLRKSVEAAGEDEEAPAVDAGIELQNTDESIQKK